MRGSHQGAGIAVFLTDSQVRRLTGLNDKDAQLDWFRSKGIRHWENAAGKPIVPVCEIERPGQVPTSGGWSPDFSRIGP